METNNSSDIYLELLLILTVQIKCKFLQYNTKFNRLKQRFNNYGHNANANDTPEKTQFNDLVGENMNERRRQLFAKKLYPATHEQRLSHTAETTHLEIRVLGFGSDLAPFDFSILPSIERQLKGQLFVLLTDLRMATSTIVQQYECYWYEDMFRQVGTQAKSMRVMQRSLLQKNFRRPETLTLTTS